MDAVPVFSQAKSLIQFFCGDCKGAIETQINFSKRCPVLSQCVSAFQCICGNADGAKETQKIFLTGLSNTVDAVPVVGHLKAGVHQVLGQNECARNAAKAANHTSAVIAGGTAGFLLGGPPGAALGGAAAGMLIDASSSILTGSPCGHIENLARFRDNPKDVGNVVDLAGGVVIDGIIGHTVGSQIGEQINRELGKRKLEDTDISDPGVSMNEFNGKKKMKSNSTRVITEAKDQRPIANMELQTRVPDVNQVVINTSHDSQAIVNISQSENSSAMGGLVSVAVGTGAVGCVAVGFDDLRRNVVAREEPQE